LELAAGTGHRINGFTQYQLHSGYSFSAEFRYALYEHIVQSLM
jgi:hypothetical protein